MSREQLLYLEGDEYEAAFIKLNGRIPRWVPVGTKFSPDWKGVVRTVRAWARNYHWSG